MLKTLALVLPVLFPSWRFFKSIEPSPRVEWSTFAPNQKTTPQWREFRPRPNRMSTAQMIRRLFWNPDRNEALFIVSCAERIQQNPTAHSIGVIQRFIQDDIAQNRIEAKGDRLKFRLVFVRRDNGHLVRDIVFLSDAFATRRALA